VKPRVLFVGRTRYRLPLADWLERKWTAIGHELEYRVLASEDPANTGTDPRFELIPAVTPRSLDGAAFYAQLAFRVRRAVRSLRPQAIVAEDPRTAALVMAGCKLAGGGRPRVICEVHGDWRHSTRLYGSQGRQLLSPLVDLLDDHGVSRADAVRALSPYTARLVEETRGRPPDAVFPTYTDLSVFTSRPAQPLPERPAALFVGMLERYKNVDGLAAAWRIAAGRVPEAPLVVVGKGPLRGEIDRLAADLPGRVEHVPELPPEGVARALDEATLLVLPSRREGLGRVVIEAFARGRGVVASCAGGVLDLVDDGVEGLLVDPEDTARLADALVRVLSERDLAERLGAAASARFAAWNQTAEEFARRTKELVEAALN
jgi:glycosyltransferase involved in cell wall biosynthesis